MIPRCRFAALLLALLVGVAGTGVGQDKKDDPKKKVDPNAPPEKPASKLEKLIMGPIEGASWNGSGSMAAAFFHKDGDTYRDANPDEKAKFDPERNGERAALVAFESPPSAEK